MLLGPQCPHHIFRTSHDTAALVVETENRRYHIGSALRCFQGWRTLHLISDPTCCRCGPGTETSSKYQPAGLLLPTVDRRCNTKWGRYPSLLIIPGSQAASCLGYKQQAGRIPAPSAICAGQSGRFTPWGKHTGLLGIPRVEAVLRNEGLLFHSRLGAQRTGRIVEVADLVPLVSGEGDGFRGRSRQWNQPRLCQQRRFQLWRQFLPTFRRSAQDTQAGCPA